MEPPPISSEAHETLELAAYSLWQQRGCPIGSPEVDWFQAEQQLHEQQQDQENAENPIVAAAKAVGAALGSVAGIFHVSESNS